MPEERDQIIHAKALIKERDVNEEEGTLGVAVASSAAVDRMDESIDQEGWDLKNFKKNPIMLWAHNAHLGEDRPPIGRVKKIWIEGTGKKSKLMFIPQFDMADQFATMIFRKFKDGFLNAFSVGFKALERVEGTFLKSELLEISAVPVPANPEALVQVRGIKGAEPFEWADLKPRAEGEESKAVVPFKETPMAPESMDWDAAGAKKRMMDACMMEGGDVDWAKYRKGFAWYDATAPDKKGSYKLPHHDMVGGEMKVVWRGCAAAMAALLGARGGTDIPDGDRRGVYNHLSKHYQQFDKEVPDFRHVEEQTLKSLKREIAASAKSNLAYQLFGLRRELKRMKADRKQKPKPEALSLKQIDSLADLKKAMKILNQATNLALQKIKTAQGKGGDKNE